MNSSFYNITRPNRLTETKDVEYHKRYARHCIGTMGNATYQNYINKCLVNWAMYKGDQWTNREDLEAFFMDDSGDYRNRIKWTKNVIKPMVQQYIGNAIRLSFDARAESISDFVINKREKDLKILKGFQRVTELFPFFKDIITDRVPVGDTELETEEIFQNTFVDEYEQDITNLMSFISKDVKMEDIKVRIATNLALCGLGIYKGYEVNNVYLGDARNPLNFIRDMSAVKEDLTDSEFMGEWYFMDAPSIFERYQDITSEERLAIENYAQNKMSSFQQMVNNVFTETGGKIPVYELYWKDIVEEEYGWVMDEFGYPYYTAINCGKSIYTDKDLIEPPTPEQAEKLDGKLKTKVYTEELRYAIMIIADDLGTMTGDIVLEYGIAPYQEKNLYDPANTKFPYKCYTWAYDRGEILTPLDDAIDPQRLLNRTISVFESHLSNARGSGTVIAKDAIDDNEAETVRNINQSKPIMVDTARTGSVQNSIGSYGSNIAQDLGGFANSIAFVEKSIQDVTGVNESMTGTQGSGQDVLVGVVEAQIQRGSLVQEPFYYALTNILVQAYEHQATVGKAVYCENPRKLAIANGDKGFQNIIITKDHLLQDFRTFIERSETRESGIKAGNQLLFTLLQVGLIDDKRFANLFDRADSRMIAKALREYSKEKQQAQNMQDKQTAIENQNEQVQQQQIARQVQQTEQDRMLMDQANNDILHQQKLEEIAMKNGGASR
jgi:SOS response regulatory protein OraA/RecX